MCRRREREGERQCKRDGERSDADDNPPPANTIRYSRNFGGFIAIIVTVTPISSVHV